MGVLNACRFTTALLAASLLNVTACDRNAAPATAPPPTPSKPLSSHEVGGAPTPTEAEAIRNQGRQAIAAFSSGKGVSLAWVDELSGPQWYKVGVRGMGQATGAELGAVFEEAQRVAASGSRAEPQIVQAGATSLSTGTFVVWVELK